MTPVRLLVFLSVITASTVVVAGRYFPAPLFRLHEAHSKHLTSNRGTLKLPSNFPLVRQEEDFLPDFVFPSQPAISIPSTNSLRRELASWTDLVLFRTLIELTDDIFFGNETYVILAPTQGAFQKLLVTLQPELQVFSSNLDQIVENLRKTLLDSGLLTDILRYHIIKGNFTEQELADLGSVTTLQGELINSSAFPFLIGTGRSTDSSRPSEARRIYRSIETRMGRLMMINSVLLPLNLEEALEGSGLMGTPGVGESPFENIRDLPVISTNPYVSFRRFVAGRTDTLILSALFAIYEGRIASALPFEPVHFFAPTDSAFIKLVEELLDEKVNSEDDVVAGIIEAAAGILNVIRDISGIPTLPEILLYHFANTSARYEELVGQGPQRTFFPNSTFSVVADGVVDNDLSRGEAAKRIASFPTFVGWVTVIDSVLLPFDSAIAKAVINANLSATETTPSNCPEDDGVCFAGDATVKLSTGSRVRMRDLEAGDEVHINPHGETSKIYLFTHRAPTLAQFTELETESGRTLRLTKGHYLYVNGRLAAAGTVRVGDSLDTEHGPESVVAVRSVVRRGVFAPHSVHGDLMVDGIRVSSYTRVIAPRLAHALLAPIRAAATWAGFREPLGSLLYGGVSELWRRPITSLLGGKENYYESPIPIGEVDLQI